MSERDLFEHLCEFVEARRAAHDVPGVGIGVSHKGATQTAGFGVTSVESPLPVTDETLFQIGSITKTFTGTAIMRLVEMGKVDLDATVSTYLPDFCVRDEEASATATIRHLLTHTGGWVGDFFHETGSGDDALSQYASDMADLEQLAPVGTVWSYNNSAFSVAGRIIEVVTGESYEVALSQLVLEPLGLTSSFFGASEVITHRFVVGHYVRGRETKVARPWPLARSTHPAGGIVCHVKDLLEYARFHLGDGRTDDGARLLRPESMSDMQTPQVTVWGKAGWGLSWSVDETHGVRQVSHGGSTVGQSTHLMLVPAHDLAVAALTNADNGGVVTSEVSRYVMKHYIGVETADSDPLDAGEADLKQYVGRYTRPFADIELAMLGGRLVGQVIYKGRFPTEDAPPRPTPLPMPLGLTEKDRLIVVDGHAKGMHADLIRDADGSIAWLRLGRLHRRQE